MGEPGIVAFLALVVFVPASLGLFFTTTPHRAVIIALVGGMMFLPELAELDAPGLPPLEKRSVAAIAVYLGVMIKSSRRTMLVTGLRGVGLLVVFTMFTGFGTALTNQDPLWYGPTYLPPLTLRDGVSVAIRDFIHIAMPFLVGRAVLYRRRHLEDLMQLLVVAGLVYSLFILVEIRLSPQFHNWIYGYGQHDFSQTIRWGGYRPMVFMAHGLAVGVLMAISAIACMALAKSRKRVLGLPARFLAPYLLVILFLTKSLAALLYGLIGAVLMLAFRARGQARAAVVFAALIALYPAAQTFEWVPDDDIIGAVESIAADRADSLAFRMGNERDLSDKMKERWLWGWGDFGRNRLYDPIDGYNKSVTDGYSIIQLSTRGAATLIPIFLLLLLPVLATLRRLPRIADRITRVQLAGLSLILVFQVLDLLPNGMFTDLPFFFAGGLVGLLRGLPAEEAEEAALGDDLEPEDERLPDREADEVPLDADEDIGDPLDPDWVPNRAPGAPR